MDVKKVAGWAIGITVVLIIFIGPTDAAGAWQDVIGSISTFFTELGAGGG